MLERDLNSEKKTNARWNIFFMLAIICTINYIDRAVISVCMPQITEELAFSPETVGAILSAFFWGYALMQIPCGWLCDRFKPGKILLIGGLCWGIFQIFTGLISSSKLFMFIRTLLGVSEAPIYPAGAKLQSIWLPATERSRGSALVDVGSSLGNAFGAPLVALFVSMIVASAIGIPLGVLLLATGKNQVLELGIANKTLSAIVNCVRSIPFIILMVAIIPFTRLIVGSSIGTTAAIVPLIIASIPLIARLVETSLREVPYGLIEAALSMGATPYQIIRRVLLPEAMPSIVAQLTTVIIVLIGESAMAGAVGGGGLGDLAIRYGYQRFNPEVMLATVIVLIVLVQVIQFLGNMLAKKLNKK